MTLPQLRLDSQLCFLFHRISREITASYRPRLEGLGLTYPQYLVMLVLWESDGVTVGQIGRRLALESATLSPLLRRLSDAGLVVKQRSTADERRVTVHLTPQGRALEARAAELPAEMGSRIAANHAEYVELRERLELLVARLAVEREEALRRTAPDDGQAHARHDRRPLVQPTAVDARIPADNAIP